MKSETRVSKLVIYTTAKSIMRCCVEPTPAKTIEASNGSDDGVIVLEKVIIWKIWKIWIV